MAMDPLKAVRTVQNISNANEPPVEGEGEGKGKPKTGDGGGDAGDKGDKAGKQLAMGLTGGMFSQAQATVGKMEAGLKKTEGNLQEKALDKSDDSVASAQRIAEGADGKKAPPSDAAGATGDAAKKSHLV